MSDKTPVMHIYAQPFWHADAFIMANREALESLKSAIEQALETGAGMSSAYVGDGEGYNAYVVLQDKEFTAPEWSKTAVPYTDAEMGATEVREEATTAFKVLGKERYVSLAGREESEAHIQRDE